MTPIAITISIVFISMILSFYYMVVLNKKNKKEIISETNKLHEKKYIEFKEEIRRLNNKRLVEMSSMIETPSIYSAYKNPEIKELIDKIPLIEGFEVPAGFPVPTEEGVIIDRLSIKEETKTQGGIILPESIVGNSNTAVIMSVGPNVPEYYRPGLKILHATNGGNAVGTAILINQKQYYICSKYDIIAIIPPSAVSLEGGKTGEEKRKEERLARNAKALNHKIIE